MVRNGVILIFLALSFSWSSESGSLAYRAQKSLAAGKWAKSYMQLEKALLATRKESDLLAEGRVLITMSQIRTQSLDFVLADSLLSIVRINELDTSSLVALTYAKMALFNAQERYRECIDLSEGVSKEMLRLAPDLLQGNFWSEKALALTALKKNDEANLIFKNAKKELSQNKGKVLFVEAQLAHLRGELSTADSLYAESGSWAIKLNNTYVSAAILFYRAQIALQQKRESVAVDYLKRSAQAFELMGLPNNQRRSESLIP